MKKFILIPFTLVLAVILSSSCRELTEAQKKEYGILCSAVTFASDKVIGEYGDRVPDDFDGAGFMRLVRDKMPEEYYEALLRSRIRITPKKTYYLLLAHNGEKLVLFDYSCSPEVDGTVLLTPEKYDLRSLESYDKCKTAEGNGT